MYTLDCPLTITVELELFGELLTESNLRYLLNQEINSNCETHELMTEDIIPLFRLLKAHNNIITLQTWAEEYEYVVKEETPLSGDYQSEDYRPEED